MKRLLICMLLICAAALLSADLKEEAMALKNWLATPFSASALEAERDARLGEWTNLQKGEFETSAQFEQRQKDSGNRIKAIQAEYTQKIQDARSEHDSRTARMRGALLNLLAQSRETVAMNGQLGAYDADRQLFRITTNVRSFDVVVPLDKGPLVKKNFSKYSLLVTRQLDENLSWSYLEARIQGPEGTFASTDKAPAISGSGTAVALIPPDLRAAVSFSEPGSNNILDAEETAEVKISISNSGKGSASLVEASFDLGGAKGISYPGSVYFGEIKPGASVEKSVRLVAGTDVGDALVSLKINFREQNGFPPDDKIVTFSTLALRPPDLYVADVGITDFSGNGKIEPGEQVEVRVRVHNRGSGGAKNVTAEVDRGINVFFVGEKVSNSFNLGDMASGEHKDIVFDIVTAKTATQIDLKVDLKESRAQFSKPAQALNLAFNQIARTADQMVVQGKAGFGAVAEAPSLAIDVELDIPQRAQPDKNRWGVIFGIETYKNVSSVSHARRDAEFIKEYFQKVLGIPAANIYFKTDDGASLGEFNTVFGAKGWLEKNANKKDHEIFVFYSGHGVPDTDGSEAFLLPSDGNPNFPAQSGFALQELYTNLGKLKAKSVTLFLDSCFSGSNRDNQIILASAKPVFISPELPALAPNLTVFSAAGGSQIASSYSDMQHGLFSYFLMKGLRGEADKDGNRKITQAELNAYVSENVSSIARRMGREQDPQLQSGEPDRVLLQW